MLLGGPADILSHPAPWPSAMDAQAGQEAPEIGSVLVNGSVELNTSSTSSNRSSVKIRVNESGPDSMVLRKVGFRKFAHVEAMPFGSQHKVLWASDLLLDSDCNQVPHIHTEKVTVDLNALDENNFSALVRQDDRFEIRVIGVRVESMDKKTPVLKNTNEVVVYSLECDRDPDTNDLRESGVPRIHFNYKNDSALKTGVYQEIPFSRSLVFHSTGSEEVSSVNVRFKIMELDNVDKSVRDSIQGISNLSTHVSSVSMTLPYLSVLSPAIRIAGDVGRKALDSYAKPDHVMTIDTGFRIAPRILPNQSRPGEYLRYGYYFFLSEAVKTKLYASTSAYNQVLLMMRRVGPARKGGSVFPGLACVKHKSSKLSEDMEFVPLTKVSYLVVKVGMATADCSKESSQNPPKMTVSMVRRLQCVVESARDHPAELVKRDIVNIIADLNGESRMEATADLHIPYRLGK
jgi:hypothetical protein